MFLRAGFPKVRLVVIDAQKNTYAAYSGRNRMLKVQADEDEGLTAKQVELLRTDQAQFCAWYVDDSTLTEPESA